MGDVLLPRGSWLDDSKLEGRAGKKQLQMETHAEGVPLSYRRLLVQRHLFWRASHAPGTSSCHLVLSAHDPMRQTQWLPCFTYRDVETQRESCVPKVKKVYFLI